MKKFLNESKSDELEKHPIFHLSKVRWFNLQIKGQPQKTIAKSVYEFLSDY